MMHDHSPSEGGLFFTTRRIAYSALSRTASTTSARISSGRCRCAGRAARGAPAGVGSLVESGSGVKDIEYAESVSGLASYRADGMTLAGYDLVP